MRSASCHIAEEQLPQLIIEMAIWKTLKGAWAENQTCQEPQQEVWWDFYTTQETNHFHVCLISGTHKHTPFAEKHTLLLAFSSASLTVFKCNNSFSGPCFPGGRGYNMKIPKRTCEGIQSNILSACIRVAMELSNGQNHRILPMVGWIAGFSRETSGCFPFHVWLSEGKIPYKC